MATLLYEELVVKCGVILMSDNKQYEAGKALWQKIAQESDKLAVFILDSDVGQFYPYCGDRVPYNGKGIPEEKFGACIQIPPNGAWFWSLRIERKYRSIVDK